MNLWATVFFVSCVLGVGWMGATALGWTGTTPRPPRPRLKGDNTRPVRRLTGADPLDGLWGQSTFPVAPDDLGDESEHHLVLKDDDELR